MPAFGAAPGAESERHAERHAMVEEQIVARRIADQRTLSAMRRVPRHRFVPRELSHRAYEDGPLPIGHGQTISQPFIVAYTTEHAQIKPGTKVLEIGTGSGYQAAVAAEAGADVYSIEIVPELAERARAALHDSGYGRVHLRTGDGYKGWPEEAPFDVIIVTAAPDVVPPPLIEQLKEGGRMIIPVGPQRGVQELRLITKSGGKVREEALLPVAFVPFTRAKE